MRAASQPSLAVYLWEVCVCAYLWACVCGVEDDEALTGTATGRVPPRRDRAHTARVQTRSRDTQWYKLHDMSAV